MQRTRNKRKHDVTLRASYEVLEPRQLLATLTVTTANDVADGSLDGLVSLREAIIATNTNAAYGDAPAGDVLNDRIEFDASLLGETITLLGTELSITEQLTIRAEGEGVTIDGNLESRVFAVDTDQDVILRNLTITGGLHAAGSGVHVSGGGTLRLFESTISFNGRATDPGTGEDELSGGGAGVYLEQGTLVSNGSTFSNNNVTNGAAIYSNGEAVRIYDSVFERNNASRGGGAIWMEAGKLFVADSTFDSNDSFEVYNGSGEEGGAIAISDRDTSEDGTFAFIVNSTFDGNSSGGGGAIFSGANNVLHVRDSSFTSNRAFRAGSRYAPSPAYGGAILNNGSLRLVDVSFSNNGTSNGGAVFSNQDALFNRVEFKGNTGFYNGGAVTVTGNAKFYSTVFGGENAGDGNHSNNDVSDTVVGRGGALAVLGAEASRVPTNVTVIDSKFEYNSAGVEGGAIYVGEEATLTVIANTDLTGNYAYSQDDDLIETVSRGGGISNYGSTLLASVRIWNSTASHFGGAIYSDGGLTMINSSIYANQAYVRGGGMEVAGGSARLYSTSIGGSGQDNGNLAGVYGGSATEGKGGGVFVSGGIGTRFQMNGGKISTNSATVSGGGILSLAGAVVRLDNGVEVTRNRALREDGGGAYNHGAHFEIRDAVFEGNLARRGAGIFNNVGSATLTGSVVSENRARLEGGGFYNRWSFLSIDSDISENVASQFPDIFDET